MSNQIEFTMVKNEFPNGWKETPFELLLKRLEENGFSIKEGDIIGLDDKKILAKSQSLEDTVLKLIAKMKEEFHCVITLYYGEDVNEADASALCDVVAEKYPDCEVSFQNGGQSVYYYIIAME